jgi:hypothetical protein
MQHLIDTGYLIPGQKHGEKVDERTRKFIPFGNQTTEKLTKMFLKTRTVTIISFHSALEIRGIWSS